MRRTWELRRENEFIRANAATRDVPLRHARIGNYTGKRRKRTRPTAFPVRYGTETAPNVDVSIDRYPLVARMRARAAEILARFEKEGAPGEISLRSFHQNHGLLASRWHARAQ